MNLKPIPKTALLFFCCILSCSIILAQKTTGKLSPDLQRLIPGNTPPTPALPIGPDVATNDYYMYHTNGNLLVNLLAQNGAEALANEVTNKGITVVSKTPYTVTIAVSHSQLNDLNTLGELVKATPEYKPLHSAVSSQGDAALKSDLARTTFGVNGAGVKVGIVSDSYNYKAGASAGVAAGELPGPGNPDGFTTPVQIIAEIPSGYVGNDEGRAMVEIIHDVAPGAEKVFATAYPSQAGFANNIIALKDAGCKVIVDDVLYFAEPFFQNGLIAQAVNTVKAAGVSYFTSAGNNANTGYENTFRTGSVTLPGIPELPGSVSAHNFAAAGNPDMFLLPITLQGGGTYTIILQWDEPFKSVSGGAGAQTDLDLFLYNGEGTAPTLTAASNNLGADPIELLRFTTSGGYRYLAIRNSQGPTPGRLRIMILGNGYPATFADLTVPGIYNSTCYGHANAAGAIATAAAAWYSTPAFMTVPPVVENYSSRGGTPLLFDDTGLRLPSPVVYQKPEITTTDGTNTSFYGTDITQDADTYPNFFGTSAAAPHAAAVAALMIQSRNGQQPLTPEQIKATMQNSCIDMDDPDITGFQSGFDYRTGYGLLQADAAVSKVNCMTNVTLTAGSILPICAGATSFTIPCTATTGTPTSYSISGPGITSVTDGVFSAAPSSITVNLSSPARTPSIAYTLTLKNANNCVSENITGTVTVNPVHAITLTSNANTETQSVCINTAITPITYSLSGGATNANVTGLPTGVTATFNSGVLTISGSPTTTAGSPFSYGITTTGNVCAIANESGSITVNPVHAIALTSNANTEAQTLCINTAIAPITYSLSGGATNANVTGLPTGVTATVNSGVLTISGSPTTTVGSPFSYGITTIGNACIVATESGSITVNPAHAITLTSNANTETQSVCINTAITPITYSLSGGATNANVTGLPTGVTAAVNSGVLTISGSPTTTVGSPFSYGITTTGNVCGIANESGSITVNPVHAIALTSNANTEAQTLCINTAIAPITYSLSGGATNANVTGLPTGVTATVNNGVLTISGSPTTTVGSPFSYGITTTGNACIVATESGSITVNPAHAITLTSNANTETQSVCINMAITPITYSLSGGATNANVTGLPTGVTAAVNSGVLTISGSPTTIVGSPFSYGITTTGSVCAIATESGSITVNPVHAIALTSNANTEAQTLCINTAITPITYSLSGGATNANVTGLPTGVTATVNSGVLTISGSPTTTVGSPFSYGITTIGNACIVATETGSITVNPAHAITLTSNANTETQSVCINMAITPITYSLSGGATNANVTGLPTGVTAAVNSGVLTISGSPTTTVDSPFSYGITTTGNVCAIANESGSITVNPVHAIALTSNANTEAQILCINTAITPITYSLSGGATNANVTGLPTGVTATVNSGVLTISGSPTTTVGSPFSYGVSTIGNACIVATESGSITVNPAHAITLTSNANTETQNGCINTAITPIFYHLSGGATNANVTGLPTGVTATVNSGVLTISGSPTTSGNFTYSIITTGNSCATASKSGAFRINIKPVIALTANGQTFNEGANSVFCDTDTNPVNPLQFAVSSTCVAGSPVWRVQVGSGAWSDWSTSSPTTQFSNNQAHRYQAACDANCLNTYTQVIALTLNYRASTPQNVSMTADGTTVLAGEEKSICDQVGDGLTFNATCAAGERLLYSVDGGVYLPQIPSQIVDGQFHNYRVRCQKSDGTVSCVETESGVMRLKISTIVAAPVASLRVTSGCGTPSSFSGTANCGNLTTVWYNATTNVALPNLPTTTPNETTSYYARCQGDAGCQSGMSNTVTFTVVPVNTAPTITVSSDLVCTGASVTVSVNCPTGSSVLWNTGVSGNSFTVSFNNITTQGYSAKCIFENGCQSPASATKTVRWKAFELTIINIGQSKSAIKTNDRAAWASQFVTADGGPNLDNSTEINPTLYFSENANKTGPRYWTIHADACALGTNGSLTFDMLLRPESGVAQSFNTHENNAPYFMYANRDGYTELYAQNHPAYGFYLDNGTGRNVYDTGLPKGFYKLGVRYWDQKGQGSIYPSTRQPQGTVLAYQEYWFRIQSKDGVGVGAARVSGLPFTVEGLGFAEVAPNPVSSVMRLKVTDAKAQKVNISLIDASGRTLLQRGFVPETNAHQEEFEVSELANGMYFLKVNAGEKQTTLKVVKVQ